MKKILLVLLAMVLFTGATDFSHAKATKPPVKTLKATLKLKRPIFNLSCSTCTYPNDYIVYVQYNPTPQTILNVNVYDSGNNLIASNAYNVFSSVVQTANGYTFSNFYVKVGPNMVNSSGEYRR
ncbi:MAG: hypothetical protein WC615_01805 [Mucilaginibacter sp.]|jgi:hypothetical protein|uniref:hypothetical protein n=1 Tax=Mucilaginibacter sp. TaxID=1882438 RepID=UPI003565EE3B